MAKQCPSKRTKAGKRSPKRRREVSPGGEPRVFKNTYVRGGVSRQVNGWAVRIQHQGVRKTISLLAERSLDAGVEAREIQERVLTQGWEIAAQWLRTRNVIPPQRIENGAIKQDANYWKERLIRRKYMESLRSESLSELSVRIGDEARQEWFPLGTESVEQAAAKALLIHRTLVRAGWEEVCARFPRELTVAIFWAVSPVAITYTTIHTLVDAAVGNPGDGVQVEKAGRKIAVVERDRGIQRALAQWLAKQPGVGKVMLAADVPGLEAQPNSPELVLINRSLMGMTGMAEAEPRIKFKAPGLPVFAYATAEHIDHIFNSLSGVMTGYIFRRRIPSELLEPIKNALRQEKFSADQIGQEVRQYFSQLFQKGVPVGGSPRITNLTERELEILSLLSKGSADKEIADALRISAWTVHSHLKKIYEKLRVHTRTEAVVRYLEK